MAAVAWRAARCFLACALSVGIGSVGLLLADPLGVFLHGALGQFNQPHEVVAWCAGLTVVAVLLLLASGNNTLTRAIEPLASRFRDVGRMLTSVPAGISLPVVVGLSFAARSSLDYEMSLPRVFADEMIYSGVAKSLAMGDGFRLRGVPVGLDYGFLVPGSLGLVYALTRTGASAYHAIQALNALAMSLAAIPAYYLARRILAPGWSLVVACLTVATPAMAYAPLVMTEAFFYPIFVTATLALTLAVEQPTWRRQALAIALILIAASTRVQGVVLIPSLATAVVLEGASARRPLATSLRRFTPSWVLLAAVGAVALVATRGHPAASLGTYADLVRPYSIVDAAKWLMWNLAALELSLGIVAFAALLVALPLLLAQNAPSAERAFGAMTIGVVFWTAMSVAVLSASPFGLGRLHWRNLFAVIPVVLVCFAWWLASGRPRPRVVAFSAAAAALALPLLMPPRLAIGDFGIDSPSTRPWGELIASVPSVDARLLLTPFVALGGATFLFARRTAFPLVTVVLAFIVIAAATDFRSSVPRSSADRRFAWVDELVPSRDQVVLVAFDFPARRCPHVEQASMQREFSRMTEFFNRTITRTASVWGPFFWDDPYVPILTIDRNGELRAPDKSPVRTHWAVADTRVRFAGTPVAREDLSADHGSGPTGSLTLWRVDSRLRVLDPESLRGRRRTGLACVPPNEVSTLPAG